MIIERICDTTETNGLLSVTVSEEHSGGREMFLLSAGEWKRLIPRLGYCPGTGEPVTEALYDALRESAERTAALRECGRYLSSRDRSEREIRRRMGEKGIGREAADYAIGVLRKRGYLNEEAASERLAQNLVRSSHYGRRRIAAYLISHGYPADTAREAADAIPKEDVAEALRWQMARKKAPDAADQGAMQKWMASLMRLGFTAEEIRREMKESRQ